MTQTSDNLSSRAGLPAALRYLIEAYPRDIWTSHAHFDAHTRFWMTRHLEFRRALAMMQEMARAGIDRRADPRRAASQLGRIGRYLTQSLHLHHHIEDTEFFPMFADAEPGLARGFDLLDADHVALGAHIAAMEADAAALAGAAGDGAAMLGPMLARLDGFEAFLDRHLIDEEDLMVPIVLKHGRFLA